MNRVASRQRLVSWDAFDATTSAEYPLDINATECYHSCEYEIYSDTMGKRKRTRNLIPNDVEYVDLPDDIKLQVCGFLSRSDLKALGAVNTNHADLLRSEESLEQVWMPLYQSIWEFLDSSNFTTDLAYPQVIDLAARKPAQIDKSLVRNDIEVSETIKFTGRVGLGDRCVRADRSLPTPKLHKRKFLARLRSGKYYHEPFVAPFRNKDGSWNLQKRLVSYFEVSILDKESDDANSTTPECVAVGLATAAFNVSSRMPGWDSQSFGFHGDDGGIFHNAGSMRKIFGRSFGGSDVIGCGIDYECQKIFYTRNGSFLGYAFELKEHQLASAYFPVIGMDTNCPVVCNFGQSPFLFDLKDRKSVV